MSEIAFAIDGLYAAGWWPRDRDHCMKSEGDQRWHPTPEAIRATLEHVGFRLHMHTPEQGHPITIRWNSPLYGCAGVTARSEIAAWILTLTRLYPLLSLTQTPPVIVEPTGAEDLRPLAAHA